LGCPAVPLNMTRPIINTIKEGSCLFIYSPQVAYASRSRLLQ
ncbi:MAG: murein L,D-transpeptidase catalytic domain family protein, partial [Flavihumibacter sp.]